jgi:hypothetical protein
MKKVMGVSLGFGFLFLMTVQMSLSSCTKETTNTVTKYDTVTEIQKDTVVQKDTILSTAILTANSWKIQVIRAVSGNTVIYYLRGGTSNTQSFDNEYITFRADGTGLYVDNAGGQYSLTWQFADATFTKITYTIQYSTPLYDTWENIVYKNGAIMYDEYNTEGGTNNQSTITRIPK